MEMLQGAIERVTFHSQQSGFCVLRVKVKGQRDLVTVTGTTLTIHAGEYIECQGSWVQDKNYGLQFKATQLAVVAPTTLAGIEKYLASGVVKGIGPHFAKKLVRSFGEAVLHVIEFEPQRLLTLPGIGKKRQERVTAAWAEQKIIRNIMIFLQSHGVGTARAVRIYKTYGEDAIDKLRENPYRLAQDIIGIGFKTADTIAMQLGIARDSILRAQAGVHYVLQELCKQGHCAALLRELITASHKLLEMPTSIIEQAIATEVAQNKLIQEEVNNKLCVYSVMLYYAELRTVEHILRLKPGLPPWGTIDFSQAMPWVEKYTGLQLSASQQQALQTVLTTKLAIITGGPGVGKTTIINSLLKILQAKKLNIALCAPTGRAAKRLTEATQMSATTIHRLLNFDPKTYGFKYNQNNLLPVDVLVIDESSMLDILLFSHLLKAVPSHAAMIFVGDIDQLPAVGAGAVLSDLIRSQVITTVCLTEIFRQASHSNIIVNAHRINNGKTPLPNVAKNSDFFTIYADTAEEIYECLIQVVCVRLPQHYKCSPVQDIQVLTPMNRSGLGSRNLNIALQQQLNSKAQPTVTRFGITFAPGDKVIQIVNNYDKEVYNGDIGFIKQIDLEAGCALIEFDKTLKEYEFNELDELSLAYAISIHKSQGSEFPIVVIPLSTQHYPLLARNLLYTGITRGKKLVVLIGQNKAIRMAVHNAKSADRLTNLAFKLAKN